MYLVTGGAGFIGSNIVAALTERGARVIVADRLGEGEKWQNLAKRDLEDVVAPEHTFAALDGHAARIEGVIHMGAISATTETDGDRLLDNNFRLSRDLWHWCAARGKPLVYASSGATYGDGSAGFDDSADMQHLARLRPLNGYGWTKHLFDRWAVRRVAEGEAAPPHWAGLKFFNVYGPNEYHKAGMASVAWHLFNQITRGEPAKLFTSHHPDYPDGGQLRDFVWVGDAVDVTLWLLEGTAPDGLYNVGSGQARSFADLAGAVFAALGAEPRIEYVPMPEAIRAKYQYFTEARLDRLRAAGYTAPMTALEDGVAAYVRDFLQQDDPYR